MPIGRAVTDQPNKSYRPTVGQAFRRPMKGHQMNAMPNLTNKPRRTGAWISLNNEWFYTATPERYSVSVMYRSPENMTSEPTGEEE